MDKATLSLYLDDLCNLNCNYCNLNHRKEMNMATEDQIKQFILNNKQNINFDYISLLGGEPSIIYSNDFLYFLNDNFKEILITTNLYDEINVEKIISIVGNKLLLTVSYNDNINDILIKNIEKFKNYIDKFSIVVNNENVNKLFYIVKQLSKFEKKISLSPEIDKNLKGYKFNTEEFKIQLKKIFNNQLYKNLVNYNKILNNRHADYDLCKSSTLNISKSGKLSSCTYVSDIYKTSNEYVFGNIFNTKINDIKVDYKNVEMKSFNNIECKKCKKCHNYKCISRYQVNKDNKIQQQICEFNSTLYDFIISYKYKPNLKSITMFMTEQCNMKCTYCFEKDFKNRLGKVSNEVIEKSLDLLFSNDNGEEKKFTFFGGEPSLNIKGMRHTLNYYLKLKNNGLKSTIFFDINTNLLVLTDELIELFKEIRIHAPFYISVSCDGFKEINDSQRIDLNGKGTYDKVISNVIKLRSELNKECNCTRVKICKHTVLSNQNIKFIEKICDEAFEQKNIFDDFSITYITPGKGEHEMISMENLKFISDFYTNKLPLMSIEKQKFIKKYLDIMNLETDALNNEGFSLCDVVDSTLSIRSNGDIIPCHAFLDKIDEDYSKIKIENILNIDINNFGFDFNSQWHKLLDKDNRVKNEELIIKSELGYECKLCPFKFLCHTCIANLKEINGNLLIKTEEQCMRVLNQAEILLKIKEMQAIKELKELQNIEDEMITNIANGIMHVSDLAINNRQKLMEILGNEE